MGVDLHFMQLAIEQAKLAQIDGEVPVGAVLVRDGELIATGYNRPISIHDPTAHAEIIALREGAKQLNNYRLTNTTLYVTLEPCAMCLGAIAHARVKRVVYGAMDPKLKRLNHDVAVEGGFMADECGDLLRVFFHKKRQNK